MYNVEEVLHIYNLKMNKHYETRKKHRYIDIVQFTIDSKILFSGDSLGNIYGYLVKTRFKTFYK